MKVLLLILPLLVSVLPTFSQQRHYPLPVDTTGRRALIQEVVLVDGATQQELYDRARAWVSTHFISARAVLDQEDRQAGRLVAKGWGYYTPAHSLTSQSGRLWRTLTIEVKDGRYRYQFTDFYFGLASSPASTAQAETALDRLLFSSGQYDNKGEPRRVLANVSYGVQQICLVEAAELKQGMQKPVGGKDW